MMWNLKGGKEEFYDKEGNVEVDAADYSVGDYGRTHGTGRYLVYGDVERRGRRLGSSAPFLIVISIALEMTMGARFVGSVALIWRKGVGLLAAFYGELDVEGGAEVVFQGGTEAVA